MRFETSSSNSDRRAVATVGLAMAALSAAVAASGLAIPLPEVVYRVAAVVGVLADRRDDGARQRDMAPDRVVMLAPEKVVDRESPRASDDRVSPATIDAAGSRPRLRPARAPVATPRAERLRLRPRPDTAGRRPRVAPSPRVNPEVAPRTNRPGPTTVAQDGSQPEPAVPRVETEGGLPIDGVPPVGAEEVPPIPASPATPPEANGLGVPPIVPAPVESPIPVQVPCVVRDAPDVGPCE